MCFCFVCCVSVLSWPRMGGLLRTSPMTKKYSLHFFSVHSPLERELLSRFIYITTAIVYNENTVH